MNGKSKFYQIYNEVLEQYGNSFGDPVFLKFITLPIATSFPAAYRLAFWTQFIEVARFIHLDIDSMTHPNGISAFFNPIEQKKAVLSKYLAALSLGFMKSNNLLFHIAVHHLSCYIKSNQDRQFNTMIELNTSIEIQALLKNHSCSEMQICTE